MIMVPSELLEIFIYVSIISSILLILKTAFQFFKWFFN